MIFFPISIISRIFTFSLMKRTSWFLLGLEALTTSLLFRSGAIIMVNKGFLNTNTVIMRQLIRTARMLEAEWWQVCGEASVWRQRKMSQVLGTFGLLYFTMLGPLTVWRAFWNLWTVYFFYFPNFFRPAVNHGYWICGYGGPPVRGGADKSLARPTSQCRRTVSIVPLERGVCSCAEL